MVEWMKAAVLHDIGDIRVEKVPIPSIEENEILIRVKYCGICGSDLPRSMINGARYYPIILGHEFSGYVQSIGNNVQGYQKGDSVTVAPLIPCGECRYCKSNDHGLCDSYNIIGTGSDGGFAQYVKVPVEHVIKLPIEVDLVTAAGIEPAAIGYHGVTKANIKPGESVVVFGCGPIGQLTIQWAKIFGASKIIAVDVFDQKLKLAKELGATDILNASREDLIKVICSMTEGGADVSFETAGTPITQSQSIRTCRKQGRAIWLGISHQPLSLDEKTVDYLLRGEIFVQGSWNSYTAPFPGIAWSATLDFMKRGEIDFKSMISHKIQIDDLSTYLYKMAKREIEHNKVLLEF